MVRTQVRTHRRRLAGAVVSSAMLAATLLGVSQHPASATVSSVRGSACAYSVNVGLFGGPQSPRGCGTNVATTDISYAPEVSLPPGGSSLAITASDTDGAQAKYGPAVIHGGLWPANVPQPTPSGPQFASTQGTPEGGTVTSSADITLHPVPIPNVGGCEVGFSPPCDDPGGFGPPPVYGDSLHAECTATETSVSGSSTFSNSFYVTKFIVGGQSDGAPDPNFTFPITANPAINETHSGVITNVGDVYTVVLNQHIYNSDGSLTVNAVHMYLFGPIAVGEVIRGQATCGTTPSAATPADDVAPTCAPPVVEVYGPADQRPREPRVELVGTFDAGGLQSFTNIQVEHGTVALGQPSSAEPYLHFTAGMTGPLAVTATRDAASESAGLPLTWSFDVTDVAGNTSHCSGVDPPRPPGSPLAYNDYYTTPHNTPLSVAAPGVLSNDTDPQNDPLTAGSAPVPANGSVSLAGNGSFTYTPNSGFSGVDGFDYTINDGNGGTDLGHVAITVKEPNPTLSVGDVSVTEGKSGTRAAVFTVSLSKPWDTDVTVNYATANGTAGAPKDYTGVSGTLTFPPNETTQSVEVQVLGDSVDEATESFKLLLSSPTQASITDGKGIGTIVDDDPATVAGVQLTIGDVRVYEGESGFQYATFTVSLSKASASTVTVNVAEFGVTAGDFDDYFGPFESSLEFAPGVTSMTIQAFVLGDSNVEGNETFKVKLSGAVGATITDAVGLGTIINDDV